MKSDYIDIVPVRFEGNEKVYLFSTTPFKHLKKGDIVRVQGTNDYATLVADSNAYRVDGGDYKWLLEVFGATEPLKRVIGIFSEIKYKDDDEGVDPF